MEAIESFPGLYPLTSLQVGNIKSQLFRAYLFFAPESHKFLILVDNQSWMMNKHSRSTHLMLTKYRKSLSGKSRSLPERCSSMSCNSSIHENNNLYTWVPNNILSALKEKVHFSEIDSCKPLNGFIVFEVNWKDVRGINYTNELQTDASLALETKFVRRWEFSSINEALCCISSWFLGMPCEMQSLRRSLVTLILKSPLSSREITTVSKQMLVKDSSKAELFQEDVFFDVMEFPLETDLNFDMDLLNTKLLNGKSDEPLDCHDMFLLLRFDDQELPYRLKRIITSDLNLLALLEAGLPFWVIFLQSYPLLCKVYHQWMRSAVRSIFIMISLVTIVIGFYDLYKNFPPFSAAISKLYWPLVKWVEDWHMFLRIRYIGTIMFFQNLQKVVKWFTVVARVVKVPALLLRDHLIEPLEEIVEFVNPLWCFFAEVVDVKQLYFARISHAMDPLKEFISDLAKVLLAQLEHFCTLVVKTVKIFPEFSCSAWQLITTCTRGSVLLGNYVISIVCTLYQLFQASLMGFTSSMCQLSELAPTKHNSLKTPLWLLLTDDLYSKIFRPLRKVMEGLIAFCTSCVRHRISYSRGEALWQLCQPLGFVNYGCFCSCCRVVGHHHKVAVEECMECESNTAAYFEEGLWFSVLPCLGASDETHLYCCINGL